jgi:hypothetical protein
VDRPQDGCAHNIPRAAVTTVDTATIRRRLRNARTHAATVTYSSLCALMAPVRAARRIGALRFPVAGAALYVSPQFAIAFAIVIAPCVDSPRRVSHRCAIRPRGVVVLN